MSTFYYNNQLTKSLGAHHLLINKLLKELTNHTAETRRDDHIVQTADAITLSANRLLHESQYLPGSTHQIREIEEVGEGPAGVPHTMLQSATKSADGWEYTMGFDVPIKLTYPEPDQLQRDVTIGPFRTHLILDNVLMNESDTAGHACTGQWDNAIMVNAKVSRLSQDPDPQADPIQDTSDVRQLILEHQRYTDEIISLLHFTGPDGSAAEALGDRLNALYTKSLLLRHAAQEITDSRISWEIMTQNEGEGVTSTLRSRCTWEDDTVSVIAGLSLSLKLGSPLRQVTVFGPHFFRHSMSHWAQIEGTLYRCTLEVRSESLKFSVSGPPQSVEEES